MKKFIKETLSLDPIKGKITLYALGTAIEGIAIGLFLSNQTPFLRNYLEVLFLCSRFLLYHPIEEFLLILTKHPYHSYTPLNLCLFSFD